MLSVGVGVFGKQFDSLPKERQSELWSQLDA